MNRRQTLVRSATIAVLLATTAACGSGSNGNDAASSRTQLEQSRLATAETVPASYSASTSAGVVADAYVAGGASASKSIAAPNTPPQDPPPSTPVSNSTAAINQLIPTDVDHLSTFALDVDTGSYTLMRQSLNVDQLPDVVSIRPEEWVNYFEQGYAGPDHDGFAITVDGAPSPFLAEASHRLIRVGLSTRQPGISARKPLTLTWVIDVSGSMGDANKMELVKESLHLLLDQLRNDDRVGIVVYSDAARTELEPTAASNKTAIAAVIDRLAPEGSTNAEDGLKMAFDLGRKQYRADTSNKVVLFSDGVANVGETDPNGILQRIKGESTKGLGLTTFGFGFGTGANGGYNDPLMEKLADAGDGVYGYIDNKREAERELVTKLMSTLETQAKDAKVQVDFDPATVAKYRLIGFENRAVADTDFRNDAVDAGEIGPGHQVTALYEIELKTESSEAKLGTVSLRYASPKDGKVTEVNHDITAGTIAATFERASVRFRLAATVAGMAEVLRGSQYAKGVKLTDIAAAAETLSGSLDGDADVAEFVQLAKKAAALQGATSK